MRWVVFLGLLSACAHSTSPVSRDLVRDYRQFGNYPEAFDAAKAGLCENPSDVNWVGEYAQAWSDLRHPGNVDALVSLCSLPSFSEAYLRALVHASLKELPKAQEQFNALLSHPEADALSKEDRTEIYYRAGLVFLLAGDSEGALSHLAKASISMPSRVDIRLVEGQAHLSLKRYSKGIQSVLSILSLKPSAHALGKARRLMQKGWARVERPLKSDVQTKLNNHLSALERGEPSSGSFTELLLLSEHYSHSRVFTVAGMVALRLGAMERAHELLIRASELNPYSPDALRILGTSYAANNQWVKAFDPLNQAAKRNPFDAALLSVFAKAAVHLDEYVVAAEQYKTLTILEPLRALHLLHLARVQRKLEKYAIAEKSIKAGIKLDVTIPLVLEWAVIEAEHYKACSDLGEKSEAKAGVQEAVSQLLELAPKHPAAKTILASLK